ncbi:hypothetical protein BDB00DRAFT_878001 [Zychaea mexicana]|uniref:uncharacterized protein n=1 Tax=Zychaea mexicana TaxID=64656 RepID=UPI0022FEA620|nr:uncharacterized protein BDB00DRAFT_878001 [Zychaea mexicana]KAI9485128.1 hypothetical protein BDB00DRAFT_878001 [Zychaea mexicana]
MLDIALFADTLTEILRQQLDNSNRINFPLDKAFHFDNRICYVLCLCPHVEFSSKQAEEEFTNYLQLSKRPTAIDNIDDEMQKMPMDGSSSVSVSSISNGALQRLMSSSRRQDELHRGFYADMIKRYNGSGSDTWTRFFNDIKANSSKLRFTYGVHHRYKSIS